VSTEGFDRLRRRAPVAKPSRPAVGKRPADPQGRRSLYSIAEQPPPAGAITVACSRCGETSVATPRQVVGLALPSLHLPLLRREHPSWMRCPACGQRAWVRLGLRL
jgi:ribosomal protein L37E